MLSKICSRVGRYSHTPGGNLKIHQSQRLANTRHTQNTRLTELNKECISELRKIEINHALWDTTCEIEDKFREDINQEVTDEYQRVPDHLLFSPDDSPAAAERALGYQLTCGLSAIPRFLLHYTVTAPDMTLEAAIKPEHKKYLVDMLHGSFLQLTDSDQLTLASAVQPDVLSKLGLPVCQEAMNLSVANKKTGKPQLTEDHLLALVDYCSSKTGMFNAINDSMRIWQMCGVDKLASITSCLSRSLNEGLSILAKHEGFVFRGSLYKGVTVMNGAGSFRLSKMQPGMQHCSPHWSSTTQFENQNYAIQKYDRQLQLTILDAEGIRAHMFNDETSIRQGEVIMPPKPVRFLRESEVDPAILNPNPKRPTIYCTMKPRQSDADARLSEPHAIRV